MLLDVHHRPHFSLPITPENVLMMPALHFLLKNTVWEHPGEFNASQNFNRGDFNRGDFNRVEEMNPGEGEFNRGGGQPNFTLENTVTLGNTVTLENTVNVNLKELISRLLREGGIQRVCSKIL